MPLQKVPGGEPDLLRTLPGHSHEFLASAGELVERRLRVHEASPQLSNVLGEFHRFELGVPRLQLVVDVGLANEEVGRELGSLAVQLRVQAQSFVGAELSG